MRGMMTRMATALAMVAALAVAPAAAQGHHGAQTDSARGGMGMMQMIQGMPGQHGMMGRGMMGMAGAPGMILRLQQSLELTENQVTQLEALRDSAQSRMRGHMMQGMQAVQSASDLLNPGTTDLEAYEARLRGASNHMVLAHTAMARAAVEARNVLTPEQRERLAIARSMMWEMQGGVMGSGMMNRGSMMNQGGASSSGD